MELQESIVIPIVFFTFLGLVILVPIWLGERTKMARLELLREAVSKGQTLDPAMVQELTAAPSKRHHQSPARRTLGTGVVLTLIGLGLTGAHLISNEFRWSSRGDEELLIGGVIVGLIGVGYLILAAVDYASRKTQGSE